VPGDLWDAADLAAAPASLRLSRVYLPLAIPGLALAAIGVAIFQAGELEASILVAPPGCEPVSRFIASQLHYNVDLDVPAALCLFQVAAVLIVVALIRFAARFLMRENRFREKETMP
jgi:ABC-type spermidine/putrescine transport system permease subunit I